MKTVISKLKFVHPEPLDLDYGHLSYQINYIMTEEFPQLQPTRELKKVNIYPPMSKIRPLVPDIPLPTTDIFFKGLQSFYGYGKDQNYVQASNMFQEEILRNEKHQAEAMIALGKMHYTGTGVRKNNGKAFEYFQQAEAINHPSGYYWSGKMIEENKVGSSPPQVNLDKAIEKYTKASELKDPDALVDMGYLYQTGRGVEQDHGIAKKFYKKAAKQNHPKAFNNLGVLYLEAPYPRGVMAENFQGENRNLAYENLKKSVDLGFLEAKTNMGIFHLQDSSDRNYKLAKTLFEEAAAEGSVNAQLQLAKMKLEGASQNFEDENYSEAADMLRFVLAKEPNNPDANYYLGYLHQHGLGVDRDQRTAYRYYQKADKAGDGSNTKATSKLGTMNFVGKGTSHPNQKKAIQLFNRAAENGDQDAFNALG